MRQRIIVPGGFALRQQVKDTAQEMHRPQTLRRRPPDDLREGIPRPCPPRRSITIINLFKDILCGP